MNAKKMGAVASALYTNISPSRTQANNTRPISADQLLSMLDGVRNQGADTWIAKCCAHDDKSPSLRVKDCGDKILLHCFGGCTFTEICAALCIEPHQLFADGRRPREIALGVSRRDVIDTLFKEMLIAQIVELDRAAGKAISQTDLEREQLAREFIRVAGGVAHG